MEILGAQDAKEMVHKFSPLRALQMAQSMYFTMHTIGMFKGMLKHFEKQLTPEQLMAFADKTVKNVWKEQKALDSLKQINAINIDEITPEISVLRRLHDEGRLSQEKIVAYNKLCDELKLENALSLQLREQEKNAEELLREFEPLRNDRKACEAYIAQVKAGGGKNFADMKIKSETLEQFIESEFGRRAPAEEQGKPLVETHKTDNPERETTILARDETGAPSKVAVRDTNVLDGRGQPAKPIADIAREDAVVPGLTDHKSFAVPTDEQYKKLRAQLIELRQATMTPKQTTVISDLAIGLELAQKDLHALNAAAATGNRNSVRELQKALKNIGDIKEGLVGMMKKAGFTSVAIGQFVGEIDKKGPAIVSQIRR